MPEISLIGGGSVGSLLTASLLANGHAFTWVVRNPLRRAELQRELVLRIEDEPPLHLPTDARHIVEQTSDATAADWIILAVKAQQVLPLLAELSPYPGSKVLVVANGIHDGPFHLGLLYGGAHLEGGVLVTSTANQLIAGPLGGVTDFSAELLNLLPTRWLEVQPAPDVELTMWRKAALNCVVNPLTAMLDCQNGVLLDRLDSPLIAGLLDELTTVLYHASAHRLALSPGELRSELLSLLTATAGNSSSMREDLRAGRETEIDALSGAVVKLAHQFGLDCPLNDGLARMLRSVANRKRL